MRLSTRPVDQSLAAVPNDPVARERRRRQVVAGAYLLRRADRPQVTIAAAGAMLPEALQAADRLTALGFGADVICVSSPDLVFRSLQARQANADAPTWLLRTVFNPARAAPMVTVLDGHAHTLAFLATINQVPGSHLGVSDFGQSGDIEDMYRLHRIDTTSIVGAALDLVD